MRVLLTLVAFGIAPLASAGDYWLLVSDGRRPCTAAVPRPLKPTVQTSAQFVADLEKGVASGDGVGGYLSNGRVTFCTSRERNVFERALVDLGARPRLRAEREWRDIVFMFGTRDLLAALDEQIARTDMVPRARLRLERTRARLARWVESKVPWWEEGPTERKNPASRRGSR